MSELISVSGIVFVVEDRKREMIKEQKDEQMLINKAKTKKRKSTKKKPR